MPRPRDYQRRKVFEAERSLISPAPKVHGVEEATEWLQDNLSSSRRFWTDRVLKSGTPYIYPWRDNLHACKPTRVHPQNLLPCLPYIKNGCIYVRENDDTSVFEMIHQLAHFMTFNVTDQAWHGPAFVLSYFEFTKKLLGKEWADTVRVLFREHKIKSKQYSAESRKASSERWYQQQAAMAPTQLRDMIAELEN